MESTAGTDLSTVGPLPVPEVPEPIYNCAQCSHWLAEGTLACPECGHIVYSEHLRELAIEASAEEREKQWGAARATWERALAWLPAGEQTDLGAAKD